MSFVCFDPLKSVFFLVLVFYFLEERYESVFLGSSGSVAEKKDLQVYLPLSAKMGGPMFPPFCGDSHVWEFVVLFQWPYFFL